MKRIFLTFLTFYFFQCVNAQVISTVGNTFSPDTIVVNIGDTISFVLGSSHNAVEVTESAWLSNSSLSNNGFNIDYGASEIFVPTLHKTYYYVCQSHVSMGMKGVIIARSLGCTDPFALNYNPLATEDDGSCCVLNQSIQKIGENIDGEFAYDESGYSISISDDGNRVAIGAGGNDGNGDGSGHVRVFDNINNVWTQIGQDIDGESAGDGSGYSVSLSGNGNWIAIGAPYSSWYLHGQVRIYTLNNGTWYKVGQDIDGEYGSKCGSSVSISDDGSRVVICSPNYLTNNGGWNSELVGRVRVFENLGGVWTQVGNDFVGETLGYFGDNQVSISSDGNTVAIGAPFANEDQLGYPTGSVKIYIDSLGTWTQIGNEIFGENHGDYLGMSISLNKDANIIALGSPNNIGNGSNSGHVRVFKYINNIWSQLGDDINGEAFGDGFGGSVSLSGDGYTLASGASWNDGYAQNAGHARIYKFINNSWFKPSFDINGEQNDERFGTSVSLNNDGNKVAIGAVRHNGYDINGSSGNHTGTTKIYNIQDYYPCSGCTDPTALNYDPLALIDDSSCTYCEQISCNIYQSGSSLYSSINNSSLNYSTDWYNIHPSTGEYWLMKTNSESFNPKFDCHYFIITTIENGCIDTSATYYFGQFANEIQTLEVKPNPTSGKLVVDFINERSQFVKLRLVNNLGNQVAEFTTKELQMDIDLSSYPSGVYYLFFTSEKETLTTKIILNK